MTRQEAIKYLTEWNNAIIDRGDTLNSHAVQALIMAIEAIEAIEALEQEPKRGKWLDYLEEGLKWKCSECDSKFTTPWNYCPNCGARMEREEE